MSLQTILSVAENQKFYVYFHINEKTKQVFYVGKGCNKRAFSKQQRNKEWFAVVNNDGYKVKIVCENLSEIQAINAEKFAISAFRKIGGLTNIANGGFGNSGWRHNNESKNKQKIGLLKSYTPELLEIRKQAMLKNMVAKRPETRLKMSKIDRSYLVGEKNHMAVSISRNGIKYPTIIEMCRNEKINLSTFKYWKKTNKLEEHGIKL